MSYRRFERSADLVIFIVRVFWRGLFRPLDCEPHERLLVDVLWLLMAICFTAAGYYFFGPMDKTETRTLIMGIVAGAGVVLCFATGLVHRSLDEIGDDFGDD